MRAAQAGKGALATAIAPPTSAAVASATVAVCSRVDGSKLGEDRSLRPRTGFPPMY
jgi:hypothetical protein